MTRVLPFLSALSVLVLAGCSAGPAARRSTAVACATLPAEGLTERGKWQADLQASGVHGAQAAKVQVDPLTGELKVLKMVGVQDQGLILNRLATSSHESAGDAASADTMRYRTIYTLEPGARHVHIRYEVENIRRNSARVVAQPDPDRGTDR